MYLRSEEVDMGQQLSWLEHTTDNREVDGSSPFWPTTSLIMHNAKCKIKRLNEIPKVIEISLSLLKKTQTEYKVHYALSIMNFAFGKCTLKTEHCYYDAIMRRQQ